MSNLVKEEAGRLHLNSRFMRESLVDKQVLGAAVVTNEVSILPDMNVLSIGGKSIIDRGKVAVYPLLDEIVALKENYQLMVGVTGGARADHTLAIGMDFGLPVGGLAQIVGAIEEQNASMLFALLGRHGAVRLARDRYEDLPNFLLEKMVPIVTAMPPHHFWEKPPEKGVLPDHGSDFGMFMTAETLGAKSMIYIKDQDGLYDKDPEKHEDATFISKISAQELRDMDLDELIIDYMVLKMLVKSRHIKQVQIINGLVPGNLTKALQGEHVGTIIHQ